MGKKAIIDDLAQGTLSGVQVQDGKLRLGPQPYLLFNGSTHYVDLGNNAQLNMSNKFTIEARIWVNAHKDFNAIFTKTTSGAINAYNMLVDNAGRVFGGVLANGVLSTILSTTLLNVSTWYNVAFVYDATLASQNLKLFIDGNSAATPVNFTGVIGAVTQIAYLGRQLTTWNLNGRLQKVRLWNLARTQDEIAANLHTFLAGNEPGLVGLWEFQEGAGLGLASSTGLNNGTIVGATWAEDTTKFRKEGIRTSPVYNISL